MLFIGMTGALVAQKPKPTIPKRTLEQNKSVREKLQNQSLVNGISFRSIGPTVMSGRVVDLEVDPQNPTHFYAAFASGGLWETTNNGITFTPIFDQEAVMTIGDIAVDWSHKIIYIGTGENNSSRSSYSGMGIFKSDNNGKSWTSIGLAETQHIGRIILHPTDKNIFWVASMGNLYSYNKERGIYKTEDGGKTWKQTLFINEKTGVIDLIVNEKNPDILYAAAWERERKAWNFVESGMNSGIYKSTDGGNNWNLISDVNSGFPQGDGVGRIGLALCKSKPDIIYAFLDNQTRKEKESPPEIKKVSKQKLKSMTAIEFLALENKEIEDFLRENSFPKKITADFVKQKIKDKQITPAALAEYLEDANSLLFDTPITGAELYRSDDGGKSWKKTHENYIEDLVFTYGYYFGQVRVNEADPQQVYLAAFVIAKSEDGGKTFNSINGDNVHVDHHALWIDPVLKGHLINGNDGGINISYDDGKNWIRCNSMAVGQFYAVNVDMDEPYNVYGGLQDNGVWHGSSQNSIGDYWQMTGSYPFKSILEGDGMQVMIDPRDNATVYTGYQFGHYFRMNKNTGEMNYITPKHELGERPLRWNWQTPIWLSTHSPDVIYMGANKLFRSLKQGNDFVAISPDLTKGGKKGDVAFGTLTCVHESSLKFGLLYAGTDDGNVWLTKDGGTNWKAIHSGLPSDFWIRTVRASAFVEGRVYVALNGYVQDNFESMIYVSEDFGTTWNKIGLDLPMEPVNVLREDPVNENLLYVGTDNGLYVSVNRGKQFMSMNNGLPAVAVHDLVIHPRDAELVVGTHGRSIFICDVGALQKLNNETMQQSTYIFPVSSLTYSKHWGSSWSVWEKAMEPEVLFSFWALNSEEVKLELLTEKNEVIFSKPIEAKKGINQWMYNLEVNQGDLKFFHQGENKKTYLIAGNYTVKICSKTSCSETKLEITKP